MGLASAERVLGELADEGRPLDTPAVAVSQASLPSERTVVGTLGTLAARIRAAGLASPATLVVGEVARRALDAAGAAGSGTRGGVARSARRGRVAADRPKTTADVA
jgi:siroheme synthase